MVFIEKELKILQINPVSLIAKLEILGATKNYDKTLYDIYFDDGDASFGVQKKNVRIRFSAAGDCLTLKHRIPNNDYKSAVEKEYDVDGTGTLESLIDQWLQPTWAKYKRRISYSYEDLLFDMDMYPWIPALLEIEAYSLQAIRRGIKLLWLEKKNTAICGARGLFKRYNRQVDRFPKW